MPEKKKEKRTIGERKKERKIRKEKERKKMRNEGVSFERGQVLRYFWNHFFLNPKMRPEHVLPVLNSCKGIF